LSIILEFLHLRDDFTERLVYGFTNKAINDMAYAKLHLAAKKIATLHGLVLILTRMNILILVIIFSLQIHGVECTFPNYQSYGIV